MKYLTKILVTVLAFAALLSLSSCNTLRGAGRDVEHVGSAVSHI